MATNLDPATLLQDPKETEEVEIKSWMDFADAIVQAKIAKTIMALSNHGGGRILVGLQQQLDGSFTSAGPASDLAPFSPDAIQTGIVERFLAPQIQCEVIHHPYPDTGDICVVIIVPGCGRLPVRAKAGSSDNGKTLKKGCIYVRSPRPQNIELTEADDHQIEAWLARLVRNRQDELLDAVRVLRDAGALHALTEPELTRLGELSDFANEAGERWSVLTAGLPERHSARFPLGHYEIRMAYDGEITPPKLFELEAALRRRTVNHSGWGFFISTEDGDGASKICDGAVEAWLGPWPGRPKDIPRHYDFWRVSANGHFFVRRGHLEVVEQGREFDLTLPVCDTAEGIIQASYLAPTFGAEEAELLCSVVFTGLEGRSLVSARNPRRHIAEGRYRCDQERYQRETTVPVEHLRDLLPETVATLLRPLYELFRFEPPAKLFAEEIANLLNHRH